jgi:Zn finger protein HypA/HybF involved in hydrogenase expression
VTGRIDAENLAELKMQMQVHPSPIALELGELTLVDADTVRFLATAEAAGTELRNCPLFIREWIRREHPDLVKPE